MARKQPFSFGLTDSFLAEVGGVPLDALHRDVEAICRAHERAVPVAERLGVAPPKPHLAGFGYTSLVALGAKVRFPPDSEPNVSPILRSAEEIDGLREPPDYLEAEGIRERLRVLDELKKRRPDAANTIGHTLEGPATTAALILGQAFFTLPYEDPARAHRLLDFSVRSALNYAQAITRRLGGTIHPGPKGFPDDFAGMFSPRMFAEFVAPYWERLYEGLRAPFLAAPGPGPAIQRSLHSELLRVEHMPFLKELRIEYFDPSADQYLTPELLRERCPARFMCGIHNWHVHDLSAAELQAMYRRLAACEPYLISFNLNRLEDEPKIRALLETAREMREG